MKKLLVLTVFSLITFYSTSNILAANVEPSADPSIAPSSSPENLETVNNILQDILKTNADNDLKLKEYNDKLEQLSAQIKTMNMEQQKLLDENQRLTKEFAKGQATLAQIQKILKDELTFFLYDRTHIQALGKSSRSFARLFIDLLLLDQKSNNIIWPIIDKALGLGSLGSGAYAVAKFSQNHELSMDVIITGMVSIIGFAGQYLIEQGKFDEIKNNTIRNIAFSEDVRLFEVAAIDFDKTVDDLYMNLPQGYIPNWKPSSKDLVNYGKMIISFRSLNEKQKDIKVKAQYLLSLQPESAMAEKNKLKTLIDAFDKSIIAWDDAINLYQKRHDFIVQNEILLP